MERKYIPLTVLAAGLGFSVNLRPQALPSPTMVLLGALVGLLIMLLLFQSGYGWQVANWILENRKAALYFFVGYFVGKYAGLWIALTFL